MKPSNVPSIRHLIQSEIPISTYLQPSTFTPQPMFHLLPIPPGDAFDQARFQHPDCRDLLAAMPAFYEQVGFVLPWVGYFVMEGEEPVGTCSFVGAPKAGRVEIAYYTFPRFEERGIASFACAELLRIARETDPSVMVTAKTAPAFNASTRILQKHGFVHAGSVQDHEIGEAWEWRRG